MGKEPVWIKIRHNNMAPNDGTPLLLSRRGS
jgi:hypothetical protein